MIVREPAYIYSLNEKKKQGKKADNLLITGFIM